MKATHFARLPDTSLREAWQDAARDFTTWLSDNIDYLSEVLGFELEATETEVAVDTFSADIIGTEARTGTRVLIKINSKVPTTNTLARSVAGKDVVVGDGRVVESERQ